MSILVTGGAGFIGSHLIDRLLKEQEEVVCLDDFNDYYDPRIKRANVQPFLQDNRFRLYEADIRDKNTIDDILNKEDIQAIIHLAARAGVRDSLKNPLLYTEVNINGTLNLLEGARNNGIQQFIFGSSSSVYGLSTRIPFREDDPADQPISSYATTKRAGEMLCHTYHQLYRLHTTILRFFTVYGPRGRPEMAIYKFTRFIDTGQGIPVYGDGSSHRDYTYVSDIVQGIVSALRKNLPFEIFNLAGGRTIELKRMIAIIEKNLGKEAKLNLGPEQPGDVHMTAADISKAKKLLNYSPQVPLEEGIDNLVRWYRTSADKGEIKV